MDTTPAPTDETPTDETPTATRVPAPRGSGWDAAIAWLKSDRKPTWLNRRNAIVAGSAVLVVIVAAVGVGLVQSGISEQQAAEAAAAAAQERADDRQAEHDKAVREAETALAAGERRLEESEDYADPADYEALEKEVEFLKRALADDTSVTAKAERVTKRVRAIGDRPVPYEFSYTCRDSANKTYMYQSWEASWGSTVTACDAKLSRGDAWSDGAVAAAQAGGIELDRLFIYYGMCAEPDFGSYGNGQLPNLSESQAVEAAAVLLLCPNHPAAGSVQEAISRAGAAAQRLAELEQRKKDGTAFGPGLQVIGQPVQPGTYASEGNFEGCYWERTDAAGEIIDNNFAMNAARIEVTIEPGDYSFTSQRCGTFSKVG